MIRSKRITCIRTQILGKEISHETRFKSMEKGRQTALEMAKEEDAQTKETTPAEEGLDSLIICGSIG